LVHKRHSQELLAIEPAARSDRAADVVGVVDSLPRGRQTGPRRIDDVRLHPGAGRTNDRDGALAVDLGDCLPVAAGAREHDGPASAVCEVRVSVVHGERFQPEEVEEHADRVARFLFAGTHVNADGRHLCAIDS
jgi:hypothetical protein